MTAPVPTELLGLWRRELITAPGFRDDTTQVRWLQALDWYIDMRVPADRVVTGAVGFSDCSDAVLLDLARTTAGAGLFTAADGFCAWSRGIGHNPPGPLPDEARYRVTGDVMIEDGIHAEYQETWRRDEDSQGPFAAFELVGAGARQGLLLVAGSHMMDFISRPGPALQGDSLPTQVERALAAGQRASAEALLDSRIRYAERDGEGKDEAEREEHLPYTIRYLRQVNARPDLVRREREEEEKWQEEMQMLSNYLKGRAPEK